MKTSNHSIPLTLLLLTILLTQGCVNLKPVESSARFYVLGASEHSDTSTQSETPSSGLSIGLRQLRLASYLDTPYIVVRHGTNEISFSTNHRWGEDLKKAINRTVETHLTSYQSIQRVDVAPWPINVAHDYVVQIHVLQFEGQTDAFLPDELPRMLEDQEVQVHLVANWQIIDPESNAVLHQENTDVLLGGWNIDIYSNLVSGLDETLKEMAEKIAEALESL